MSTLTVRRKNSPALQPGITLRLNRLIIKLNSAKKMKLLPWTTAARFSRKKALVRSSS